MSAVSPASFFTTDDNIWFEPTCHSRGPWDANACHAGPPTGLLARALEASVSEHRLCRVTVDLLRPIPFAGFNIECEVQRRGRTVSASRAQIIDASGKVCAVASGLQMLASAPLPVPQSTPSSSFGTPQDAVPGSFPIRETRHGLPAFNGDGVDTRYPIGEGPEPGPTTVWMRTVPLLPTEQPSPFQRICPLADCGNALSRHAEPNQVSFVNADLTIVLHRDPDGEWLGSSSVGDWHTNGIGVADALLFDCHGAVGRAVQTLVLRPVT